MVDELNIQQADTTPAAQVATPDGAGNQPDTSRTFTQADVDRLMAQARAEGRRSQLEDIKKKHGDPDELAKAKVELDHRKASEMTEQQKIAAELETLRAQLAQQEQKATEATLKALRLEVAQIKGIPPALATRLQGATKEELEADADIVLASLPGLPVALKPTPPNLGASEGTQVQRQTVRLSDEEKAMANSAGISIETYIKRKLEALKQRGVNNNDG